MVAFQQLFDDGAVNLLERSLFDQLAAEGQIHVGQLLAVHHLGGGVEQAADVVAGIEHLRHAAINVQQGINRFHGGTDGVFGGEHGVAHGIGELADEGKVHAAFGHNLRAVALGAGHEERGDIGHHAGHTVRRLNGHVIDLILRHTQMIQPFLRDFDAGAFAHGLLDEVAGTVGVQAVDPNHQLILGLCLEVRLAVDGPAHQPGRILDRDDAAGHNAAGEGITLADGLDVGRNAVVQRGDGRALPIAAGGIAAELFGMAEGRILRGDVAPQVPAAAVFDLEFGGMRVVAGRGIFGAAAVGDKYEVVLNQVNGFFLALMDAEDLAGHLAAALNIEQHVGHAGVVLELHIVVFQILDHGQDQRFILVVLGELQCGEIRQAADVVNEALNIQLHLQCAVPLLESKHRLPVEPEIALVEFLIKHIVQRFVVKILIRGHEELDDLHRGLVRQGELAVRMRVLTTVLGGAHQGVVGVMLVEPIVFVQHRSPLGFQ